MKYTKNYLIVIVSSLLEMVMHVSAQNIYPTPAVNLSSDQSYVLEQHVGNPPVVIADKYKIIQTNDLIEVHDVATNNKIYEITAPPLTDIDPLAENRGFKGFTKAVPLTNGDLLLNYYNVIYVYYKRSNQSYKILPRTVIVGGNNHAITSWSVVSGTLLAGDLDISVNNTFEYVIYNTNSDACYKLETLAAFKDPLFYFEALDKAQGYVQIKTFELEDPDESDSDISIKANMGWYKIVVANNGP